MIHTDVTIINKLGLHARAAAKLSNLAKTFDCEIKACAKGQEVDAKSVMALMLLAAAKGTTLTLSTDGGDEKEAMSAIVALINDRFDEGE